MEGYCTLRWLVYVIGMYVDDSVKGECTYKQHLCSVIAGNA